MLSGGQKARLKGLQKALAQSCSSSEIAKFLPIGCPPNETSKKTIGLEGSEAAAVLVGVAITEETVHRQRKTLIRFFFRLPRSNKKRP